MKKFFNLDGVLHGSSLPIRATGIFAVGFGTADKLMDPDLRGEETQEFSVIIFESA